MGRAVRDSHPLCVECGDRLVDAVYLKGKVYEILLDLHRPAGGKTGQFNEFVAVGDFQKSQLGSPRRGLSFDDFKAEHAGIELNRFVQIADPHAGMKKFCDVHACFFTFVIRHASTVNREEGHCSTYPALTFNE